MVLGLAVAAGAGAWSSGAHPTAWGPADRVYDVASAMVMVFLASRASREARLVFAAVAMAISREWLLVPGVVTLGVAFGGAWVRRWRQRVGAAVGALGSQVLLRAGHLGFHGLTALLAAAAVAVLAASAYRGAGRAVRRRCRRGAAGLLAAAVVLSAPVAIEAFLVRHDVTQGIGDVRGALHQVSAGDASAARAALVQATADFDAAHRATGGWWAAGARLVPVASQQRQALAVATDVVAGITTAASQDTSSIDFSSLRYAGGGIDLAKLEVMAAPVRALDGRMDAGERRLAAVRSPWLVEPLQSRVATLVGQLDSSEAKVHTATEVLDAAPGLLGGDGPRTYFVAFMTPAESRGLDGYIGAYGILRADAGHLSLATHGPIADVPDPASGRRLVGPPDYLARYAGFLPQDSLGDVSYAPDLPEVATVMDHLYQQSSGVPVDGMLALDPAGLASLLQLTGPVVVPGLPEALSSANAADVLLRQQYTLLQGNGPSAARHDFLQDALAQTFPRLVGGSLPSAPTLASVLGPAVDQGHLQFWSLHPSDQPILRQLRLAGTFPRTNGGDLLAVTTDNAANNKTDAYLSRDITDQVTYDPGNGEVTSHVTVVLHNATPATGLPAVVSGSYTGSGLPPGADLSWVSLYSPLAVVAQLDDGVATDSVPTPALGVTAYSSYVEVPAGGTATIRYTLRGHLAGGATYRMTARVQPTALPTSESITVAPTGGWRGGRRCTLDGDLVQSCAASFAQ